MIHIDTLVYITQIHRTDTSRNALKPTKTYTHTHKHIPRRRPSTPKKQIWYTILHTYIQNTHKLNYTHPAHHLVPHPVLNTHTHWPDKMHLGSTEDVENEALISIWQLGSLVALAVRQIQLRLFKSKRHAWRLGHDLKRLQCVNKHFTNQSYWGYE